MSNPNKLGPYKVSAVTPDPTSVRGVYMACWRDIKGRMKFKSFTAIDEMDAYQQAQSFADEVAKMEGYVE